MLMTLDQWIASIAGIGTLASAGATFLTILQMSAQRRSTYLPEVMLETTRIVGLSDRMAGNSLPDDWREHSRETIPEDALPVFRGMPIRNVGLGAAKDVTVKWEMMIDKAVANVNHLAQQKLFPVVFSHNRGFVSKSSEKLGRSTSLWRNQQKQQIDYLLPASVEEGVQFLVLPHTYQMLSSATLFLALQGEGNDVPDMPFLRAEVEFFDISGRKMSAAFDIEFEFSLAVARGERFEATIRAKRKVG